VEIRTGEISCEVAVTLSDRQIDKLKGSVAVEVRRRIVEEVVSMFIHNHFDEIDKAIDLTALTEQVRIRAVEEVAEQMLQKSLKIRQQEAAKITAKEAWNTRPAPAAEDSQPDADFEEFSRRVRAKVAATFGELTHTALCWVITEYEGLRNQSCAASQPDRLGELLVLIRGLDVFLKVKPNFVAYPVMARIKAIVDAAEALAQGEEG
jgi:hypothetical protein